MRTITGLRSTPKNFQSESKRSIQNQNLALPRCRPQASEVRDSPPFLATTERCPFLFPFHRSLFGITLTLPAILLEPMDPTSHSCCASNACKPNSLRSKGSHLNSNPSPKPRHVEFSISQLCRIVVIRSASNCSLV